MRCGLVYPCLVKPKISLHRIKQKENKVKERLYLVLDIRHAGINECSLQNSTRNWKLIMLWKKDLVQRHFRVDNLSDFKNCISYILLSDCIRSKGTCLTVFER